MRSCSTLYESIVPEIRFSQYKMELRIFGVPEASAESQAASLIAVYSGFIVRQSPA